MKPAAEMIVHSARGHFAQSEKRHLQRALSFLRFRRRAVNAVEKFQRHRARKFRRGAEAAELLVEVRSQLRVTLRTRDVVRFVGSIRWRDRGLQLAQNLLRAFDNARAIRLPRSGDFVEHTFESGPAVRVLRRKISSAHERLQLRREPDVHGPAAAPGHALHESHVDAVEIWPLFAIDFDADETFVHQPRDLFVLKTLALHHVAPVTRRIADREKDRLVLPPRFREGFLAPRIPIDRIVRVLEQVRRLLLRETIRELRFRCERERATGQAEQERERSLCYADAGDCHVESISSINGAASAVQPV